MRVRTEEADGRSDAADLPGTGRPQRWSPRTRELMEAAVTLGLAALVVLYASSSGFRQDLTVLGATYALLALGMYVPFIMSGGLSLAYNAYLGAGAYAVALLATRTDVSSLWAIPVGMVISAVIAVAVGLATRKLSGFYLAGVTLLFGLAFETWLIDSQGITGGGAGIPGIPKPELFGWTIGRMPLVVTSVLAVWLFGLLLSRLRRSPYGIAVRGKREVPEAVEAAGINVPVLVLVSLALGAAIASVGGSLFAMMNGQILPESFTLSIVFLAVFMPLLGGQRSPWGAVLGALIVVLFTFGLTLFRSTGSLVFAVAVLLVLRLAPDGILGLFATVSDRSQAEGSRS